MLRNKFITFLLLFSLCTTEVQARTKNKVSKHKAPIETSLVVDGHSGKILHARNAQKKIYPASLTKVMTIYLIFEALNSGKLSLDHKLYVSKNATKALPCKLYVEAGERITVRDAIYALSIKSANDVARVVAENIAGSERRFARLMTIKAKQLGMHNTNFVNASGWHHPRQYTTATDLVKLSIAIKRDFPQHYKMFRKTSFTYKGKTIHGHDQVAATYPGAEGLKTGYHIPGGCNLITVATRGQKNLVGVVTGRKNTTTRDKKMVALLDTHFGIKKTKKSSTPKKQIAKKKQKAKLKKA